VLPAWMLMVTMSAGGIGGGIASAIARALGGGRRADANSLAMHGLIIGATLAAAFTGGMLIFGEPLYRALGGQDDALSVALASSLLTGQSQVRLAFGRARRAYFVDILRVGLPGAANTVLTNVNVAIVTGIVGTFGTAALAGYGLGARLEYLQIPLVFGF